MRADKQILKVLNRLSKQYPHVFYWEGDTRLEFVGEDEILEIVITGWVHGDVDRKTHDIYLLSAAWLDKDLEPKVETDVFGKKIADEIIDVLYHKFEPHDNPAD